MVTYTNRQWSLLLSTGRALESMLVLSGKFGALRQEGRRLEFHSGRHVHVWTLGKSLTQVACSASAY